MASKTICDLRCIENPALEVEGSDTQSTKHSYGKGAISRMREFKE